ncbi:shikimate 5-dehydrogenase [Pyrolobus fumarii 1A]|uniref:Shikimate dehydrogenase (NADP(+)) n=1 Tax=Pyrolobus fumarii (strain DSM 11204 / 1A) TaxID=694429 RepID=G0EDH7_PYRF1|nr:shikimate dehydrogenase [Pyrolobus fumarii]AEM38662.1 shikimate 5-dehydrogenase [Pyrolobus fumarii 1A]
MLVGPKRLYGLIGHPVAQSLSPVIHESVYRKVGVEAVYLLWDVEGREVHFVVEGLRNLANGFNVTIPHKERVRAHCDSESSEVSILGAVNTVKVEGAKLHCFNTDVYGVERCLRGLASDGFTMLVLGAGGAAKAAVLAAQHLGASTVIISNRTRSRAVQLAGIAEALGLRARVVAWPPPREAIEEADVLFNATPLGMEGVGGAPPVDTDAISPKHVVFDAIYKPLETPLIRAARERNARTVDGLCMLVWQALEADRIWLGIDPSEKLYQAARKAALEALQRAVSRRARSTS